MKKTMVLAGGVVFLFALAGCSSPSKPNIDTKTAAISDSPAFHKPRQPLVPKAAVYTGHNSPIIKHVLPGSPASKAGLRPNDSLFSINGERLRTAAEFERYLRKAPAESKVTYQRGGQLLTTTVKLRDDKPRLGAGFEPEAVPLVKPTSPLIAFMHVKGVTAYVESTINESKDEIHLNMILESANPVPVAHMNLQLQEAGAHTPFARDVSTIDALGSARVITKTFKKHGQIKGPVFVSFNVDKKQFRFEFQ